MASIAVSGADSEYSINDGPFMSAPSVIFNGQQVRVEHTSAAASAADSVVTTTLAVGNTTKYTFASDTKACQ